MEIGDQLSAISRQSAQLLGESEAVLAAAEEYIEAVRRARKLKKRERIMRRLELALRRAFREQGSIFMREFRARLRGFFAEGFEGHAQFLWTPLKETIGVTDWLVSWIIATERTVKLFSAPIDQAVEMALSLGAAEMIGSLDVGISFNLSSPAAVRYLENYGARLVAGVNDTSKDIIQKLITQAVEEGWSYDRTAQALIEQFEEFAVGRPQEHIDSRAHLIAVTETGNAYAEGRLQAAQELKAAGLDMEKAWDTVGDDKVSDGCRANAAAGWIELDAPFPSGHQRPLRFPGCRCDLLTRVKNK